MGAQICSLFNVYICSMARVLTDHNVTHFYCLFEQFGRAKRGAKCLRYLKLTLYSGYRVLTDNYICRPRPTHVYGLLCKMLAEQSEWQIFFLKLIFVQWVVGLFADHYVRAYSFLWTLNKMAEKSEAQICLLF